MFPPVSGKSAPGTGLGALDCWGMLGPGNFPNFCSCNFLISSITGARSWETIARAISVAVLWSTPSFDEICAGISPM